MDHGGAGMRDVVPDIDIATPFGRLALTHGLALGGDALVALVLAGSLFFSIDPSGARWRIALYLAFTMAPFALVGPFIGPAMDRVRGGRQVMITITAGVRSFLALTMIASAGSGSLLLFPEAFGMLVLAKTYAVAKASVVPTTVTAQRDLVEANSKLQVLGGISALVAGIPGGLLLLVAGPSAVAALAGLVFGAATISSLRMPRTVVDPGQRVEPATYTGDLESGGSAPDRVDAGLVTPSIIAAVTGMGALRWVVGFVTFLLAFALRGGDTKPALGMTVGRLLHDPSEVDTSAVLPPGAPPMWYFGVVVVCSAAGGLIGAAIAPRIREVVREEFLLVGSLVLAAVSGMTGVLAGGPVGMSILALGVAVAAAAGKQAFDAVVQRDSSESDRGTLFGRFESRFQIVWVFGAVFPVVVTVPVGIGSFAVACVAAVAALLYWMSVRAIARGDDPLTISRGRTIYRDIRSSSSRPDDGEEHQ